MITLTEQIKRRKTRKIMVGNVPVGGDSPISVQSMTNTDTTDIDSTIAQIRAIAEAGADIVRVSVPTLKAAEAFKEIKAGSPIPVVADIHFDYRIALKVADDHRHVAEAYAVHRRSANLFRGGGGLVGTV